MFLYHRQEFGLCVKATIFPETKELHIVEWIETNLRLGASKIIIYIIDVSSLMRRILSYYEEQGKVEVYPMTLPGAMPTAPFLQDHMFKHVPNLYTIMDHYSFGDCFMRNVHRFKVVLNT